MLLTKYKPIHYLYIYSRHEDEVSLCDLETRALFGKDADSIILESNLDIDPSRSPFIKEKIDVLFQVETLEQLKTQLVDFVIKDHTFKVTLIKNTELEKHDKIDFKMRRNIEKNIGLLIKGTVDLNNADITFGIMRVKTGWVFGLHQKSEAIWLHHQQKPHQYSTALSTRVARAVVNIAVPNPANKKVIDPCCGIGTILIEALSMGISITGRDINPLVLPGTRENISFFGYHTEVILGDIRDVCEKYDIAIVDMPYNLCSVLSTQEQLDMLKKRACFCE
ncbi:RNA methylase [Halalkalibacter akibai JCM 9157]|uniref:RNA methylase n=1 Tax=Halalkalibacter akibai (strain ATCC 43226 / DSM 21942 / CIP 109018 / JCM 9157 / 1139) TaxID=1236973 RepID=W4QU82_HALA3|nr:RNA methylase [Halalkalibacter akibai JCM 9157]